MEPEDPLLRSQKETTIGPYPGPDEGIPRAAVPVLEDSFQFRPPNYVCVYNLATETKGIFYVLCLWLGDWWLILINILKIWPFLR